VWTRWRTLTKSNNPLKDRYGLCTLQGYGHTLSIIRNKHQRDFKRSLIQHANGGLCTSSQKWIKTKMKTPLCFNNKGNEIITWCSFNIRKIMSPKWCWFNILPIQIFNSQCSYYIVFLHAFNVGTKVMHEFVSIIEIKASWCGAKAIMTLILPTIDNVTWHKNWQCFRKHSNMEGTH